jgi:UDP-2,3-diacylglucosamine pyrophosphatase LpxH
LANEFKSENVVLFIGSGLSNNANLPTWSHLLEQLKQQLLDLNEGADTFYNDLDPIQKAQFLYEKSSKNAITNEIKEIFDRSTKYSEIHKILVTLPTKTIITTNWDHLIEKYFETEAKTNINVIWKDDQISIKTNPQKLIKMHGDLQDPSSIVFSENDYFDLLNKKTLLKDYISTIIATSTILFIGYSFSDFDFKFIFNHVGNKLGPMYKKSYIFLPNGSDFQTEYMKGRKLTPIIYKNKNNNNNAATKAFFDDLSSEVAITALNPIDRLLIVNRETKAMLPKANNLKLRNQSNLGPLSTPEKPKNKLLFGNEQITELEIEIANSWKQLIGGGAHAKCVVCLDKNWILDRNEPEDGLQRLNTLKKNIEKYGEKIEIVDTGMPITINIGIHGEECYIESKKVGHRVKSYNRLTVLRKPYQVSAAIADFDQSFKEIKKSNVMAAKTLFSDIGNGDTEILKQYIFNKIEESINFIRENIK